MPIDSSWFDRRYVMWAGCLDEAAQDPHCNVAMLMMGHFMFAIVEALDAESGRGYAAAVDYYARRGSDFW